MIPLSLFDLVADRLRHGLELLCQLVWTLPRLDQFQNLLPKFRWIGWTAFGHFFAPFHKPTTSTLPGQLHTEFPDFRAVSQPIRQRVDLRRDSRTKLAPATAPKSPQRSLGCSPKPV